MNPDYISIYVTSNDLGQRIDVYLSEKIEKISRNRIINLIKEKKVFFNDKVIIDGAVSIDTDDTGNTTATDGIISFTTSIQSETNGSILNLIRMFL